MRDQVRGALFNILGREAVEGASVLDLFAGSGSLGIEALSRGATRATFVEREPACLEVLRANLAALGAGSQAEPVRHDLSLGLLPLAAHGPFDLVLMHPPFAVLRAAPPPGEADVERLLRELAASRTLLAEGGLVAFETPRERWPDPEPLQDLGLEVALRREYGSTALFLCARALTRPR
jgi:16S rRNA (guanine966-N2)-methyltransferase